MTRNCSDCGVAVGDPHSIGCDVARCLKTGNQHLSCGVFSEHGGDCGQDIWTGEWPGVAECREYGLYAYFVPFRGFIPCAPDYPGGSEDLNRLIIEGSWNRELCKWEWPAR